MKSSVSKQIQDLVMIDQMSQGSYFRQFSRGAVILLVLLLALGFYTKLLPYFMVTAFLGLIIFAARNSIPHLKNAVRALTNGQKKVGFVKVEKIYDSDNRYNAAIADPSLGTWHFTFVATGWKPSKSEYPATLYYLLDVAWPVLVEVEDGIMVPSNKPNHSPE